MVSPADALYFNGNSDVVEVIHMCSRLPALHTNYGGDPITGVNWGLTTIKFFSIWSLCQ